MQTALFPKTVPKLRGYQNETFKDSYAKMKGGCKRLLLVSPTGSGKTIIVSKIVTDAVSRGLKVLFFVHLEVLVPQTMAALERFNLLPGAIKAGYPYFPDRRVQVASVQTFARRDIDFDFDLVVYDEAHKVAWNKVSRSILESHDCWHLGLSATPWRLSKREGMGDLFDDIVVAPTPTQLIEMGYLVPGAYYSLDANIDLKGVRTKGGDYRSDDLRRVCDVPEAIQETVDCWLKLAEGRRTIAFAVDVEHARHMAGAFTQRGISAACVTGETPKKERDRLYKALRSGQLTVLTSVNVLSEGFDVPNIGCVLLCRPTKSRALHFQQIGRGLRIADGKEDCIVLDRSGNCVKHGRPEDLTPESFSLKPGKDTGPGDIPLKACPECNFFERNFARVCSNCGSEFPLPDNAIAVGEMVLFLSKREKQRRKYLRKVAEVAYERGYSPKYATVQYHRKYQSWPPRHWLRQLLFNGSTEVSLQCKYKQYLQSLADDETKNFDDDDVRKYYLFEFG